MDSKKKRNYGEIMHDIWKLYTVRVSSIREYALGADKIFRWSRQQSKDL